MRFVSLLASALFLALVFSGCQDATSGFARPPEPTTASFLPPLQPGSTASASNATTPFNPGWPSLANATIRSGGGVVEGTTFGVGATQAVCTANFVFQSPDNLTLYLGTAAHCIGQAEGYADPCGGDYALPLGSPVYIEGASKPGTLAYSSWHAMVKAQETDAGACTSNDFALVQVDREDRARVHPAVAYFGGPVGLANSSQAQVGERVLSYGVSSDHGNQEGLEEREGYLVGSVFNGWEFAAYTVSPVVPGDSGGPVLDASGRALGVMKDIRLGTPAPGSSGFTSLDKALAYAREHAGLDVRLATWGLLDSGKLPDLP